MTATVCLTERELMIAAIVGVSRQIENLFANRKDAFGAARSAGWQLHIDGAAAEAAFAKWSGRYWNGALGDLDADDVGDVQVRSTSHPEGSLILHPSDPDDRRFVLVLGTPPVFLLIGWTWGRDGKVPAFWRDPKGGRPAFFVPQDALRPMRRRADTGVARD